MTSSSLIQGLNLSIFTVALLKDTGYWDDVNENLTDSLYWGKSKGCEFPLKACQSEKNFEEFSKKDTNGCTFWNDGYGKSEIDYFGDECYTYTSDYNTLCEDPTNNLDSNNN